MTKLRGSRSRVTEGAEDKASSHRKDVSSSQVHPYNEVLKQLLHTFLPYSRPRSRAFSCCLISKRIRPSCLHLQPSRWSISPFTCYICQCDNLPAWVSDLLSRPRTMREAKALIREGAIRTNELTFLKHYERGKGQMMMVSYAKMEVEGDEALQSEDKPDLDRMAQPMQSLFKLLLQSDGLHRKLVLGNHQSYHRVGRFIRGLRPWSQEASWRKPFWR